MQTGRAVQGLSTPSIPTAELVAQNDKKLADEDKLEAEFANYGVIIADPLFKPIVAEQTKFVPLPHEAFSGRCFRKRYPIL